MNAATLQAGSILLSAILAVGGWLYNAHKERDFRKFELRTKYRIEMFEAALEAILSLSTENANGPDIVSKFAAARPKVGIFGTDKELAAYERLLVTLQKNAGSKQLTGENLNEFPKLLVAGFRREIGLPARSPALEPKD